MGNVSKNGKNMKVFLQGGFLTKLCLYMAKFIILWYDNFGKNHTPLHRNGMTAIPKT